MGFIKSTIPTRIYLITLFFIFLSPAVLFIDAVLDGKNIKGLTFFYGESKDVLQFVLIEGGLLFLSIVLKRLFCGGIWCALILRFIPLGVAVYILWPYLIEGLFDPSEDWFIWSYTLLIVIAIFFTLDVLIVWIPSIEDLWNGIKRWWFRLIVLMNGGVSADDNKTSSIDEKRINYPPVVSGTAILSRTILLNESTISIISLLILFALFGVYYSLEGVVAKFSGTQVASILGGVTSGPILKNMPKVKDWLYGLISYDIRQTNEYTAIIGTGPLATSFIREDVRNKQPIDEVDKAFVLYADQEELTPDLIELCQERFIGICRPSQFESRWISQIDFTNLERVFIGTGNDLTNIERLGVFMDEMKNHRNKKINITIEIEDRDLIPFLDEAFSQWADNEEDICGSQQKNLNLTLQYISYSELAAHDYFQTAEPKYLKKATKVPEDKKATNDPKDGLNKYLDDLDAASIVLIGTGKLAREFIYFLAKIWHLPTNRTGKNASPKIILMGNDEADGQPISDFYREIDQLFPDISDYFTIEIVTLDFFKDQIDSSDYEKVWSDNKLKRIFLLDDDTYRNVELVNVFTNKTYLDDMVLTCPDKSRREIFIANKSYKKLHDAMSISPDKLAASKLHHVNSIGLLSELSKDKFIFNNEVAEITQQIKGILTDEEPKNGNEDSATEMHNDLARQRSAKSLAQHLHVKLLIFGLEYRPISDKRMKELCHEQKEKSTSRGEEDKENLHREVLKEKNKGSFYEALVSYCDDVGKWGDYDVVGEWIGCGNHQSVVNDLTSLLYSKDCKPMSPEELDLDQKIVEIYDECKKYGNPIASLINCEHDRWCCYHQINNWKLPEKINEATSDNYLTKESAPEKINQETAVNYLTKESPLLKRLDALEDELKKKAIVRAFNQYLCIPEILAEADCEIHEVVGSKQIEDAEGH